MNVHPFFWWFTEALLVEQALDNELDVFEREVLHEGLLRVGSYRLQVRSSLPCTPGGELPFLSSALLTQGKVKHAFKPESSIFHVSCYSLVPNYNNCTKPIFNVCKLWGPIPTLCRGG